MPKNWLHSARDEKISQYSKLKNIIYFLTKDKINYKWSQKYNCFQPISPIKKENEKEQFISNLLYTKPREEKAERNPNKTYDKLEWFRQIARFREPTIDEVIAACEIICSGKQWLLIDKGNGTKVSVEANAKGTEAYCKKLNGKVLDACKKINAQNLDCAFITATCDIKKYGSVAEAWEKHREREVKPLMENLRKNYGVQYVDVVESTKRGYPHTHILAFFPKSLFPELEKMKNQQELKYGKLYNYIQTHKHSTQVKAIVVKGEHKIHYLTKYIGKGCTNSVFSVLENKEEFSKSDIKLIKEFVFLTAFRLRKVHYTMKGIKSENKEKECTAEVSVLQEECARWETLPATELRALLNSLCNNSLLLDTKKIYSMSFTDHKRVFGTYPERDQAPNIDFCNKFENKGKLIYQEENFYSLFADFVLHPKTAKLNRKFYWNGENDVFDRFTDGYDLDNDEDFIKCCKDLACLYMTECMQNNKNIKAVIDGRENLSHIAIQQYSYLHGKQEVCSFDPKEEYFTWEELYNKMLTHKAI